MDHKTDHTTPMGGTPQHGPWDQRLEVDRMTDRFKNVTFTQLRWRAVNILVKRGIIITSIPDLMKEAI